MSDKYHNVIGIDLGTTYSAVAAYNKYTDYAEVFRTSNGGSSIPSVVSFDRINKKAYAGEEAKSNYLIDPDNTVIEIEREMGEVVNEQNIGKMRKLGLNPVINEDPYRVFFGDDWYLPQEIIAFILMEAKEVAQKMIGEVINDAVITVPAYFTEIQKKAIEEAALLAGLYPRQLVPGSVAAGICYGEETAPDTKMKYLVYDLGGGTFDVSIIEVENTLISVIATSGDRRLGGIDFDNEITSWVIKILSADYQLDISNNQLFVAKIKANAEEAKKILSQSDDASIDLSFINDPRINNIKITRDDFEKLIDHLLHKSLERVDEAIQIAFRGRSISKDDIDCILLVGGSTRIPKVRELLLDHFGKGEDFISADADPALIMARGAAILARKFEATPGGFDIEKRSQATLLSKDNEGNPDTSLITEHSLSVGTVSDLVVNIIERGRVLPARESTNEFVNSGPSEYINVPVFQGESKYAYENTLIGTLAIGPMEPRPAGEHRFEVIFNIDQNGFLAITINHLNENKSYNAEFIQKTGVGGDDKLNIVRMKLLEKFRHKENGRFVPSDYSGTTVTNVTYPTEPYDNVISPPIVPESNVTGRSTEIETVPFEEVIPGMKEPKKQVMTENVQFTVYRPSVVCPEKWYSLLAFAHLSERPIDAPQEEPDPIEEVKDQASRILGVQISKYQNLTQDSKSAIPREGTITFLPKIQGIEFNPPSRSFIWSESVHQESFRFRAPLNLEGKVVRGQMEVYSGSILVADVGLAVRIDSYLEHSPQKTQMHGSSATLYRKIFASYSHKDLAIVEEYERYARSLGDEYLRDLIHLRSGEFWDDRLKQMIEQANVFQLFWSTNSVNSRFVEQEWRYALSLSRPNFLRPVYWEDPFPENIEMNLPPNELKCIHFQKIPYEKYQPTGKTKVIIEEKPGDDKKELINGLGLKEIGPNDKYQSTGKTKEVIEEKPGYDKKELLNSIGLMEIRPEIGLIEKPKEIPFESHIKTFDPKKELNDLVKEFKNNPKGLVYQDLEIKDILGNTLITDDLLKDLGREEKLLQKAKSNIANKQYNDALNNLGELLEINRDHHEAIYLKALCYVSLSKELEALEVLRYFVTNKPHFDLQNNINSLTGKIRNQVIVQIMLLSLLNLNEGLTRKLDSLIQLDDGYEPYYFIQSLIYSNQGILDEALNTVEGGLRKIPADQAGRLLNMKEILEKQLLEKLLINPIGLIRQGKYKPAILALKQIDRKYHGFRLYFLTLNYVKKLNKESSIFNKKTLPEVLVDGTSKERYQVQSQIIKEEIDNAVPYIEKKKYDLALPFLDKAELYVLRYPFLHYLRAYCVYHQYLVDFLSFKFSNNIEKAFAEIDKCKNDAEIAQEDRTIAEAKPLLEEINLMRRLLEEVYDQVKQMRKEVEKVNALITAFSEIMKEGTAIKDKLHLQKVRIELQRINKESVNLINVVGGVESKKLVDQLIKATTSNLDAMISIEHDLESKEKDKEIIQKQSEIFNSFVDDINKGRIKVTSRWSCEKYIENIDNNIKTVTYLKDNSIQNYAAKPVLDQIISNWLSIRKQFEDLRLKF